MKIMAIYTVFLAMLILIFSGCKKNTKESGTNIIFLHHSTGEYIWHGKPTPFITKAAKKVSNKFAYKLNKNSYLPSLIKQYNRKHDTEITIDEIEFPKASPYGWNNYPYDYYNIWIKNAGYERFKEEPTLEILTQDYDVIIFKHCYPVSNILPDEEVNDIDSYVHTIGNYKLQYEAIKEKLHSFPDTKFILFTGAVQVKNNLPEEYAKRTKEFFEWVKNSWDEDNDNIYIWDLYSLQTDGGLYFKDEYAEAPDDSHPNKEFARRATDLLFSRIVDVVSKDGEQTTLTGRKLSAKQD